VPTYLCVDDQQRKHVLANLEKLVVKPANESGGYGMLVGPASTRKEREEVARHDPGRPRNFIAQPTLTLSTVPTVVADHFEPRHVDMRPFILSSDVITVTTGGLTGRAAQGLAGRQLLPGAQQGHSDV